MWVFTVAVEMCSPPGDFRVGEALRDQGQHLALARGQPVGQLGGPGRFRRRCDLLKQPSLDDR